MIRRAAAVLSHQHRLHLGPALGQRPGEGGLDERPVLVIEEFSRPQSGQFLGAVAGHRFQIVVSAEQPAAGVEQVKNSGQALDERIGNALFLAHPFLRLLALGHVVEHRDDAFLAVQLDLVDGAERKAGLARFPSEFF